MRRFTNLEWRIMDSVNLFAGRQGVARRSKSNPMRSSPLLSGILWRVPAPAGTPEFTLGTDDTAVIGRVGGQYYFNDDVMLYASFATGYKGKGWDNWFNAREFMEDNFPVDAEKPQQVEVGFKGDFLDGRAPRESDALPDGYS